MPSSAVPVSNLHYLRYSEDFEIRPNTWSLFADQFRASLQFSRSSEIIDISIRLCGNEPKAYCHPVHRVSEVLWYVSPVVYVVEDSRWIVEPVEYSRSIGKSFLVLSDTPDYVSSCLELL